MLLYALKSKLNGKQGKEEKEMAEEAAKEDVTIDLTESASHAEAATRKFNSDFGQVKLPTAPTSKS